MEKDRCESGVIIWILTLSSNLYYRRGTWSFRHFTHPPLTVRGIPHYNYLLGSQADKTFVHSQLLISLRSCHLYLFVLSFNVIHCISLHFQVTLSSFPLTILESHSLSLLNSVFVLSLPIPVPILHSLTSLPPPHVLLPVGKLLLSCETRWAAGIWRVWHKVEHFICIIQG